MIVLIPELAIAKYFFPVASFGRRSRGAPAKRGILIRPRDRRARRDPGNVNSGRDVSHWFFDSGARDLQGPCILFAHIRCPLLLGRDRDCGIIAGGSAIKVEIATRPGSPSSEVAYF